MAPAHDAAIATPQVPHSGASAMLSPTLAARALPPTLSSVPGFLAWTWKNV
jgi:hypothetical protein